MKKTALILMGLLLAAIAPALADKLPTPKAPLQVVKYMQVESSVKDAWSLVGNHESLPKYAPFIEKVSLDSKKAVAKGHTGSIRQCNVSGMGPIQERISSYNPPYSYSYAVLNNAMGMNDHHATVELIPLNENRTLIVWKQYFEHPNAPMVAQQIDGMLATIESGLKQNLAGR